MKLRNDLLAVLADKEVNSADAMSKRLEDIGLQVTPEFAKKDIDGMRAAIREEFIPSLDAINQKKADRIGLDIDELHVADDSQASFEEPDKIALEKALKDIESRAGLPDEEYAERYNLQNVDVDFADFRKRLEEAPVEKRVRIVEAGPDGRNDQLVLYRKKGSGEFGLMKNPRQVDKELVDREFNALGAEQNGRDPKQSIVSILRSQGMEPATKTDALYVTALHNDKYEGVYWLYLAQRENMTPKELDKAQWAADFRRKGGGTDVGDYCARNHDPLQGGLGVLWV